MPTATTRRYGRFFFDAERALLRKAAFFPSLGNHERNAASYFEFLNAKPYYSFDWGTAHFIVINSDIENAGSTEADRAAFWQEQIHWLENDLREAQKPSSDFYSHHPPMTAVKRRQGDNPHMTALEPLLEKNRVSAAFFGTITAINTI